MLIVSHDVFRIIEQALGAMGNRTARRSASVR